MADSNAKIILRQTGPVFWTELKDKYVSKGSEHLPYEIYYTSPCPLLLKYDYMLRNHQARLAQNAITVQQNPQAAQLFTPHKLQQLQTPISISAQIPAPSAQIQQQIQPTTAQQQPPQPQHAAPLAHFKMQTPIKPIQIISQPPTMPNLAQVMQQNRGIPTHILGQ